MIQNYLINFEIETDDDVFYYSIKIIFDNFYIRHVYINGKSDNIRLILLGFIISLLLYWVKIILKGCSSGQKFKIKWKT